MSEVLVVIPARMGSSRFPGKPLALISGEMMIRRVAKNALDSKLASTVVVAGCDEEVREAISDLPVEYLETSNSHTRASDRTLEATQVLESKLRKSFKLVIMLQGDEPCILGHEIDRQVEFHLQNSDVGISNLVGEIASREDFANPNTIKCALNSSDNTVIFMSRAQIVSESFTDVSVLGKQVCSIAFRRDQLDKFGQLAESPLEIAESIDMLRVIENHLPVHWVSIKSRTHAVDVPSDIPIVERILANVDEPGL